MNDLIEERLHQLELYCRYRVDHQLTGKYRSVFKGQGLEFDEVRAYAPGDDVRAIDWNVTARSGEVHIKRYHEERELNLIMVVDSSPSFFWSSQRQGRHEVMLQFCALLGSAALASNDRIGVVRFSDGLDDYLPPSKGKNQLMRCLSCLMKAPRQVAETSVIEALEHLNRLTLKRSIVVIISDFFMPAVTEKLAELSRHHELLAIAIDDPREQKLQGQGLFNLRDAETGRSRWLDLSDKKQQETYQRNMVDRIRYRQQQFSEWGVDMVCHQVGEDPVETLLSYFLSRRHRVEGETGG
ncbi:DUF58 domain-containing protein [Endozoicomonas elysicola]|uniref:DUF58 domain-containing protein n=1 Tax=Endozoicomonas elysicola TaxID=305900 RepID=A0A081KBJ2_9GAMM|nr:DUF58 domain-containing protein [Endozoicomonas elysicola]KEI71518.1 hypothetical protein GV64_12905 [Endozoicomonas elysicola]